jgi:hypothetical protein
MKRMTRRSKKTSLRKRNSSTISSRSRLRKEKLSKTLSKVL